MQYHENNHNGSVTIIAVHYFQYHPILDSSAQNITSGIILPGHVEVHRSSQRHQQPTVSKYSHWRFWVEYIWQLVYFSDWPNMNWWAEKAFCMDINYTATPQGDITLKLDTGAEANILPIATYNKLSLKPSLKPTDEKLTGTSLSPLGTC